MLWVTIFKHTSGFTKDAFLWGACPPKNEGGGDGLQVMWGDRQGGNTFMGIDLAYKKSVCTYL